MEGKLRILLARKTLEILLLGILLLITHLVILPHQIVHVILHSNAGIIGGLIDLLSEHIVCLFCSFLFDDDCTEYKYYEYRIQEEEKTLHRARIRRLHRVVGSCSFLIA